MCSIASDAFSRVEIMRCAEARAATGINFERRTYFGDGPWDQRASAELGYDFIAISEKLDCCARFPDFLDTDTILSQLRLA
jgi:hypothetical protein